MEQNPQPSINILEDWKLKFSRKIQISEDLDTVPLFKYYPNLKSVLPYIKLSELPTPIKQLSKFTEGLGKQYTKYNLFMKDDQVTAQKFGGNKVRKLEFLFADAKSYNCSQIYTVGAAGSNFTTATVVHAQNSLLNFKTKLFLEDQINTPIVQRNLRVMAQNTNDFVHCKSEQDQIQQILQSFLEFTKNNENQVPPYFMPSGGSSPIGTIGYVNAAFELKEQIDQKIIPEPDLIYVPLGSAGTVAGLILGCKLAKLNKTKIIPVTISGDHSKRKIKLINLLNETSKLLNSLDKSIELFIFSENNINWCSYFDGVQYAQNLVKTSMVIDLLQKTENIQVDCTYSSKALTALVQDLFYDSQKQKNKDQNQQNNIVFWNTFCPYKFEDQINKNFNYEEVLPKQLHQYLISDIQTQNCSFEWDPFQKLSFKSEKV